MLPLILLWGVGVRNQGSGVRIGVRGRGMLPPKILFVGLALGIRGQGLEQGYGLRQRSRNVVAEMIFGPPMPNWGTPTDVYSCWWRVAKFLEV